MVVSSYNRDPDRQWLSTFKSSFLFHVNVQAGYNGSVRLGDSFHPSVYKVATLARCPPPGPRFSQWGREGKGATSSLLLLLNGLKLSWSYLAARETGNGLFGQAVTGLP